MAEFQYIDLGLKDYKECWEYQEKLLAQVVEEKKLLKKPSESNHFLLVEHPNVYTLGKSGDEHNLLAHEDFLKKIEASFYKINRGGDITYHGPGQIVGYPILDLEFFDMGVREYIEKMEEAIIATLKHVGLEGSRKNGATGVWIDAEHPSRARKICAIGVRVSRFVTMHGFALNVNTDLRYFSYINPCGLTFGVTSIRQELGKEYPMEEVKEILKRRFNELY
ncbi:MAG: lipoyl(octanoyl) transferase LipB [Mariniphaga sp.]|nr:lipoyl(octanoyl) transferase LipB [Mariniphaga sp.]MDD4425079.1 lipoyl(octanoyl) transferase LipB [Mariniphaga sp.]